MTTTHNTIERTLRATVARGNHEQHEAITILLNMEPALREPVYAMIAEIMQLRNAGAVLAFEVVAKTLAYWQRKQIAP